jgi:2'-5' RNA ligase
MLPAVAQVELVVITYPKLSSGDRAHIDALRAEHDPHRVNMVGPHLTLVYPTAVLEADALSQHTRSCAKGFAPITLHLDRVEVVEDDSASNFHTFLVPSVGCEQVVALHDALYRGPLDTELRRDVAYVPHVTVGTGSRAPMMVLAEELEGDGIVIEMRLTELTVASYDGAKVLDLITIPL